MEKIVLQQVSATSKGVNVDSTSNDGFIESSVINSNEQSRSVKRLPEIILYECKNFDGAHERTNHNYQSVGGWWDNRVSSIIVVCGVWEFFEHHEYQGKKITLYPGYYSNWGGLGDMISSFRCIS